MKVRLENVEKKIIASDRNQPRIYLTKQEAQRFDLVRPVFISIEQEDYSIVDTEVIEFFNQKLLTWLDQQSHSQKNVQLNELERFIFEMMQQAQFKEVFRTENNIGFSRNNKYINLKYPTKSDQISFPLFGFDNQIQWLKNESFKHNFVAIDEIDFEGILHDLLDGGQIAKAMVVKKNGEILYSTPNFTLEPEDIKQCLNDWQHRWKFVVLATKKYAMLFSNPESFSAVNYADKSWLVGAEAPKTNSIPYYILGFTATGVDGKNAYVDVIKAARRIKEENVLLTPPEIIESPAPLFKCEYDVMVALEQRLGKAIPLVSKVDYNTFGFVAEQNHVIALGLFDQNLNSLPESFWTFKSLKTLSLSRNKFTSLPDLLGNLFTLKNLWLQENKLTSLPQSIGNLKYLTVLNLWNNKLTSLPESISNLSYLKDLNLNSNQLGSLPSTIGNLKSLQELYLLVNQLKSLPESIGNLKNLQILDVRYNSLTEIPESIGKISTLKVLQLMSNKLSSLPDTIKNLTELELLNISDNWISKIPEGVKELPKLKEFYSFSNEILEPADNQQKTTSPYVSDLEEKIITAWNNLSNTVWDEDKKKEIKDLITSGGNYILSSPKVCEINFRLVQNSHEYKKITEWRQIDEEQKPDYSLTRLVLIHDRMKERFEIIHPSIWKYFLENIRAKSPEFRKKIPFNYEIISNFF